MSEKLLKDAKKSGIYSLSPAQHREIMQLGGKLNFNFFVADTTECNTIESVLQEIGNAFCFPIWYGANFDALYDCLTDPDWSPGNGHILLIDGIESLRLANADDFAILVGVMQDAVKARHKWLKPFWILLDTTARGVPQFPEK